MVIDNTLPEGENPIGDFTVEYLGEQTSYNSCSRRDLGFAGQLGGRWYAIYGDTLWAAPGVTDIENDEPGFHGMVRNSLSELTGDPLVVRDLQLNADEPVPHQRQFVPFCEEWGEQITTGFGGTGIVEVEADTATGALYYLVNDNEWYKGAGIARIQLVDGEPTVTERLGRHGWWWDGDTMPKYGDVAAYGDPRSDWIYVLGNPPNKITTWPEKCYIYQARVRRRDAFDLGQYEYWWGRAEGWKREVLTTFNAETAVMWGAGQGQIVYSEYFGTYVYVHLNGPTVALRTAPSPEGPWSTDQDVFTAEPIDGGFVYAGVAYPHLDPSGRTLTIAYTNNNHIQVIKVTYV